MDKDQVIQELIDKVDLLSARIASVEAENKALKVRLSGLETTNTELRLENIELKSSLNSNSSNRVANHFQMMDIKRNQLSPEKLKVKREV